MQLQLTKRNEEKFEKKSKQFLTTKAYSGTFFTKAFWYFFEVKQKTWQFDNKKKRISHSVAETQQNDI